MAESFKVNTLSQKKIEKKLQRNIYKRFLPNSNYLYIVPF